jgi:peptidoglycan/LPS O-acetylase OafA/YrhL
MNLFWERPIFSTGWLMRLDAISWGVLLGLLYPREFYRKAAHILDSHRLLIFLVYIALVVALPMVAQQVLGMRSQDTAVFGVGLIAFLGAILVWLASYDLNLFNRWGYLRALMLYLGARSYSLYLSHLVVFRVLLYIYANNYETETFINHPVVTNSAILFSGLAIAVGTSELTYRYIETPFRRKGRTLAGQILEKGFLPTPSRPKIE